MLIAFASDYGLADEFVGVCKAVMLGLAPDVRILDLSHDIPAHDVRAGALLLVRSVQYLPDDCVVVAVVDPGVGTSRRLVGVEVAGGVLLGPDNGLLAPAVAMAGGARSVIALDDPEYHLPAPGPTFAGRDVLAPAAGHLAAGVPLAELGSLVDPAGLVPGLVVAARGPRRRLHRRRGVVGRPVRQLPAQHRPRRARRRRSATRVTRRGPPAGGEIRAARWVHTYADAKPSELVLLVDSYGLLSLAFDRELRRRRRSACRPGARSRWCPKGRRP